MLVGFLVVCGEVGGWMGMGMWMAELRVLYIYIILKSGLDWIGLDCAALKLAVDLLPECQYCCMPRALTWCFFFFFF